MSTAKSVTLGAVLVTLALTPAAMAGGWKTYDEGMAKSWAEIYNTGDAAAVAAYYAKDGMRLPPNAPRIDGRQAIQASIEEGMEMGIAKVELETDEFEISGDQAFTRGTYVIIDREGNQIDNGKWIQIAKRIDGAWYAHCDIWNSDNPLPE